MSHKPVVLRGAFNKRINAALLDYAKFVIMATYQQPMYDTIQIALVDLEQKTAHFENALYAAKFSDELAVTKKNTAQSEVLEALNQVANGLDFFACYQADGVAYILNAGMKTHQMRAKSLPKSTYLAAPMIQNILPSNIIPGEITIVVSKVIGAKNFGFEYSEDEVNWTNGLYSSKKSSTLKLPSRKDLYIRVRAIGTRNRNSEFSAPVRTFVL
jgi:hypothetical protein